MTNVIPEKMNFLLVSIIPQRLSDEDALKDLKELKSLVEAYDGIVVDLVVQKREVHDKGMYIGKGKIQEVGEIIKEKSIQVVVLNAIVKPHQLHDIKSLIIKNNPDIQVWDRVDLILHIFSKHARTKEANLQIELASMRHMGPRIYGMGMIMSRQTGGIGVRGIGETNTERMRRHWRDQMKQVQDKLDKLTKERERHLEKRRDMGLYTISIVGYTNAGKTSLFNRLTGKKNLVEDALFATLDSSVGKLYLHEAKKEVLITDTIGFINNLPTRLIDAFKSTLMESIHADLLIHLIDVSDPEMHKKIKVVEHVLYNLFIGDKKKIYVFNKSDAIDELNQEELREQYAKFNPQFISVLTGNGIQSLLQSIQHQFWRGKNEML